MQAFAQVLQDAGIVTTIRKTRGDDIDAACGQLAGEVQDRTGARDRLAARRAGLLEAFPNVDGIVAARPDSDRRRRERVLRPRSWGRALPLAALAVLAACTSTTTVTTSTAGSDGLPPRTGTEPGDAQRRAQVRLELAGLYLARGQANTALDEVNLAIAAKPDLPEAYNLRGLIHAALGDPQRADDDFQRGLRLNPRDGNAMHNYGWFLCQQQRFSDAEAQFERALQQPQYREITRTLLAQGVCQARAGQWAQAERTLSRCYELDPANPVTAYNLSEVLLRRGELERARFYVQRINAQPDQSSAQSLWLAVRIERRLGNLDAVQSYGRQLQERFPKSTETLQFERGRFDD